ncbi:hypothetical protein INR49_031919 [Caranx melampygus]|nr:hypothetical protein INR49_031919 [Caranx melampygus]
MESERDSREPLSRSVLHPSAFTANEIQTVNCESLKTCPSWSTLSSCLSLSNLSPMFHSQPLDFPLRPALCLPLASPLFPSLRLKAFAWWSDLMVEHAETFLCLYSADMDAALEVQPPDSWDSFPLFQLLNDFLRMDYNLCNGKFHKHLQDLYAPLVVRYVDLMESSIAQSIHRGFERESWEPVNNGSGTSEDLFWKLDALQTFIKDLHWPEEEFGKHLETRLKLMSSDMIESCVKRTRAAFEAKLQRSSRSIDFRVPQSICTMFNVMVDAKAQSAKLCAMDLGQERQYHSQIDNLIEETVKEMITLLVAKVKAASKYVDVPVSETYLFFDSHSM